MKCIHCGANTTYPVRNSNGRRCGTCLHPFAFEPKSDLLAVSDGLFDRCIRDVSAEKTLQFTARELYYELNRRLVKKSVHIPKPFGWTAAGIGAGGIIGGIAGISVLVPAAVAGVFLVCVIGAKVGKGSPQARVARIAFSEFENKYLIPYIQAHGEIPGLLPPLPTGRQPSAANAVSDPPDLNAYSFDRALVVDRAEIAAMLVANRFHFENNCAILSLDERFPANGRFHQLREMLRRNPRLIVFALHSASIEGLTMAPKLRDSAWFPDPAIHIVDMGLRPKHAIKSNLLLRKDNSLTVPMEARPGLEKDELAWLEAGFMAELECLRPQKLMRAIYQGFAQATTVGPDGEIILLDTGPTMWVAGSDPGIYAADSFG